MEHLVVALYLLVTAFTFARLEIEIEGPNGWASSLPTWRISNKWTALFYGRRPLTGYHLWLQLFVILVVHLPLAMRFWQWSWPMELQMMGFIILFFIVEDFLWFVLNPAYGLRRFRPQHIWWHAPTWWWIMPRDYWVFCTVGAALYLLGAHLR